MKTVNVTVFTSNGEKYEGEIPEFSSTKPKEPIDKPISNLNKKRLGEPIYVADYIKDYDYSNTFDVTTAFKKALAEATKILELRYKAASAHPKEPQIEGRIPGTWSKGESAHVPPIIFPEGSFHVSRDIFIPGNFSLSGAPGWNTTLRLINGARIHILGTYENEWGLVQTFGGLIEDLKFVPDNNLGNGYFGPAKDTINLYGNLSNFHMERVHIMNTGNANGIAIRHHGEKGVETPIGKTEDKGNVHLKECSFRNLQIEGGKCGIITRAMFDSDISDCKIVYCDHGIHVANARQSSIYNNRIIIGKETRKGAVGISGAIDNKFINVHNNFISGYKHGMLFLMSGGNPIIHLLNYFENVDDNYQSYNKIIVHGWKAPYSEGLLVEGQSLWAIG